MAQDPLARELMTNDFYSQILCVEQPLEAENTVKNLYIFKESVTYTLRNT